MSIDHGGYVQYGCGLSAPAFWTNFDASPTLRLQKVPIVGSFITRGGPVFPRNVRYGDIVKGLPISQQSCVAIYCSHVLEHLALDDLRIALRNTLNYLQPGRVFRFVLPDLRRLARDYVESDGPQAARKFMEDACLGIVTRPRGLKGLARSWLGNSKHLWMWDFESMQEELQHAGFTGIRRAFIGDSSDPLFSEVEAPDRWEGCLGIECRRPDDPTQLAD